MGNEDGDKGEGEGEGVGVGVESGLDDAKRKARRDECGRSGAEVSNVAAAVVAKNGLFESRRDACSLLRRQLRESVRNGVWC